MNELEDAEPGLERGPLSEHAPRPVELTEVPSARTSKSTRAADAERCPHCGAKRLWDHHYCEDCGYDFTAGAARAVTAPAPTTERWEAVITADRELFDGGEWEGLAFPDQLAPVSIPVEGQELRIGRGELEGRWPEIDLEDPAVSRFHALLVRQDDGSYSIVDQGSTNGTTLNDDPTPLAATVEVELKDGDRIHLGAWTTITLRRISPRV